ncbi:helix-turn-helix domain-containing protein [Carnobacterium maltaromaticum]|nr:helix-turn-helix domain-containing protein [Carnobacterium maltaromaticum]
MINNKELSIIVKKRRKELKMSQVELAKGICTQGTISNRKA